LLSWVASLRGQPFSKLEDPIPQLGLKRNSQQFRPVCYRNVRRRGLLGLPPLGFITPTDFDSSCSGSPVTANVTVLGRTGKNDVLSRIDRPGPSEAGAADHGCGLSGNPAGPKHKHSSAFLGPIWRGSTRLLQPFATTQLNACCFPPTAPRDWRAAICPALRQRTTFPAAARRGRRTVPVVFLLRLARSYVQLTGGCAVIPPPSPTQADWVHCPPLAAMRPAASPRALRAGASRGFLCTHPEVPGSSPSARSLGQCMLLRLSLT